MGRLISSSFAGETASLGKTKGRSLGATGLG